MRVSTAPHFPCGPGSIYTCVRVLRSAGVSTLLLLNFEAVIIALDTSQVPTYPSLRQHSRDGVGVASLFGMQDVFHVSILTFIVFVVPVWQTVVQYALYAGDAMVELSAPDSVPNKIFGTRHTARSHPCCHAAMRVCVWPHFYRPPSFSQKKSLLAPQNAAMPKKNTKQHSTANK